jgi:predicted nucleic acid-binding protein
MSADRTFVDTNILIYAHDADTGAKHRAAKDILRELWDCRTGVLSMQVLQEFYVNATKKAGLPRPAARAIVDSYIPWCIATSPSDISAAFRIEDEARISFWDALIVAVASRAGATTIVSEDFNAGQLIAGIRIKNPFSKLKHEKR